MTLSFDAKFRSTLAFPPGLGALGIVEDPTTFMTDQDNTGIKSSVETIGELIGTRLFQPAAIQRDFSWETDNCRALFEDIYRVFSAINPQFDYKEVDVGSPDQPGGEVETDADIALSGVAPEIDIPIETPPDTYLLGPMYLSPPANGVTQIFDGLQRMTSLTLLLAVMRDRLDETHADWTNWLHAFVEDQNWGYRLTYPSTSHKETVTARWLLEFAQKRGETRRNRQQVEASTPRGRVARAIKVFRHLTHDMPPEEIIAFAAFLMSKVQVVAIELNVDSIFSFGKKFEHYLTEPNLAKFFFYVFAYWYTMPASM